MDAESSVRAPGAPRASLLTAGALIMGAASLLFLVYALHSVMPYNPVDLPRENDLALKYWSPEGWKFFTRDPREDWLLTYLPRADGTWRSASLGPNGRWRNLLGFDRRPRSQMIESAFVVNAVPSAAWRPCKTAPEACLRDAPQTLKLSNPSPHPSLCGSVGLALQQQKPWAWASNRALQMPSRVAKVEVTCSRS